MKNTFTKHAIALAVAAFTTQAAAQVTLFDGEGFQGRSTTAPYRVDVANAASIIVMDNNMWEACDVPGFQGFCTRLLPGRYPSIASMGHRNRVASIRIVNETDPGARPAPRADYRDDRREERRDFRRRGGERLYDVPVANVRAVVGAAEQRCWVEREQVSGYGRPSAGGAIAGALIGGILGHQIGGRGRSQDVATVGGAVVGGAIGANVGRDGAGFQDVQRCQTVSGQAPAYWDVTYFFRGQEHRIQMSSPPGPTIQVNESGEPRG